MKVHDNQTGDDVSPAEFADRWEKALQAPAQPVAVLGWGHSHKSWLYYNARTAIAVLRMAGELHDPDVVVRVP